MKTLKQLSDEEQIEARIVRITERFQADMERIDREHRQRVKRFDKYDRLLKWGYVAVIALAVASVGFCVWKETTK